MDMGAFRIDTKSRIMSQGKYHSYIGFIIILQELEIVSYARIRSAAGADLQWSANHFSAASLPACIAVAGLCNSHGV